MKKPSMRLQFNQENVKTQLEKLAVDLEVSLNQLVNMICAAEISEIDRKSFQLHKDIAEYKKVVEGAC